MRATQIMTDKEHEKLVQEIFSVAATARRDNTHD